MFEAMAVALALSAPVPVHKETDHIVPGKYKLLWNAESSYMTEYAVEFNLDGTFKYNQTLNTFPNMIGIWTYYRKEKMLYITEWRKSEDGPNSTYSVITSWKMHLNDRRGKVVGDVYNDISVRFIKE